MPQAQLHKRGTDNNCEACDEPFPCPTYLGDLEMSRQIVPSPTVRARDLAHQLRDLHNPHRIRA
jgi:hypothetical protein